MADRGGGTAVLGLVLAATWTLALAQKAEEERDPVADGKLLYGIYCASCHGASGRGDGPAAEELAVRPANLTKLSKKNDGEFPTARVHRTIDGRDPIAGHVRGQMPIWGLAFQEADQDTNQEKQIQQKIRRLIAYLKSIQKNGEE